MSQESRAGNITYNLPTIWGEEGNGEKESSISLKRDSNMEDLELVQEGQSETTNDKEGGEKRRFRGIGN